jgi:hypothetical protein
MPSEDRKSTALDAIRPRIERFQAAVTTTADEIRGLLAGTGDVAADQSAALGFFAQGRVNVDRFSSFTPKAARIDETAEAPTQAAQEVLNALLALGDKLFVLRAEEGSDLGAQVAERLAQIGRAFAAAHVVELSQRSQYREEEHAPLLDHYPFAKWSRSERALAPGLVIELPGSALTAASVVPFLDGRMKIVFCVEGDDAPPASLARVVSPGVFVQQENGDAALEAFAAFDGVAVAALLPKDTVRFVHDPAAGETTYERFVELDFPREVRKRALGGISAAQQAEDYALLEALSVVPAPSGEAAEDPAGKLSAWLLSQADLASANKP